ncbi:hypothetical protein D910_10675 [Dendroctonus ponderosae]|uniref:DUF243 domain-containing protein n=1 Tax=Dendroctonus ponderosae TaxID=77166 RepID=U4ULP0_DENPD|nr:hypothetical protein D910_10675 [Dendroctonus ponderosae]
MLFEHSINPWSPKISLCICAFASARPEAGYSYPVPAGPSLSLPGPSIGGSHGISSINLGTGGSHGADISHISLTTSGAGSLGGHGSSYAGSGPSYLSGGSSYVPGGSYSGGSALLSAGHGGSSYTGGSSLLSGGHGGSSFGGGSSLLSSGHGVGSISGGSLLSGGHGSSSFGSGSSSFGSGSSSFGSGSSGFSGSFSGGNSFGSSASLGNIGGGSTIVQKHIYVHVPPPEPEDFRPQRIIPVAPAQKHYKIIFIKAPSAPTPTVPAIPLQPQNEEKTLVYVLVKKPEEAPELSIPAPIPTQPSKPEVYFIRYKTQKESSGGVGISGSSSFSGSAIDDSSAALAGSGISGLSGNLGSIGSIGSLSSSHGGSSSSSFISSSSGGSLSSSYGPPGHVPGPY